MSQPQPEHQTRNIDSILDRLEHRRSNRIAEFPPDFVHGDATLDEVYDAFGADWVEGAAFVQHHCDPAGRPTAVSIAYFTDWFLTVEHLSIDDVDSVSSRSLNRWLRSRIGERRCVVELQTTPCETSPFPGSRWIDLHCRVERLEELERAILRLTREGSDDWTMVAQTNLLSTITLCARLGMPRVN